MVSDRIQRKMVFKCINSSTYALKNISMIASLQGFESWSLLERRFHISISSSVYFYVVKINLTKLPPQLLNFDWLIRN